jgi:hypothetical protein
MNILPKTVYINSINEYDEFIDYDNYIIFPPGGQVGDNIWTFQYMHNLRVANKSQKNEPIIAPKTFIYLKDIIDDKNTDFNILVYFDDLLIDKIDGTTLEIFQLICDIKPEIPIKYESKYVYFINTHTKQKVIFQNNNIKKTIHVFVGMY